ncbi:hypothetical protein CERSUDRAFT_76380 [Gelatoporia subvermispora B]|uniref:Uncharacterized protein n=1 Tax=Ceriporiopsis subvermispora (strain B) TaxID=914234 RepID=M2R407_CERS8|nr:hypothetical protein CERSUDRAFT_76380 [Gelatoporia subvermispora B]
MSYLDKEELANEESIAKSSLICSKGGIDTAVSTLHSSVLPTLLYAEVQRHAQQQLANVVGLYRLPEFSDQASLPYFEAICKECMRWRLVVPLSIHHKSTHDDDYNRYFVPKGTLMIQNTWRLLNNHQLSATDRDPGIAAFGAGRRDITPALDTVGKRIGVESRIQTSMLSYRSPAAEMLILGSTLVQA